MCTLCLLRYARMVPGIILHMIRLMQEYQYCWCVDPLDGTKEFVKRNGEFTIMVGLLRVGGECSQGR